MIDLDSLPINPLVLLAAAVVVLWVARTLANMAFKIVLALAVIGAFAVVGGANLPTGMDMASVAAGLQSGLSEAVTVGGVILRNVEKKEKPEVGATSH